MSCIEGCPRFRVNVYACLGHSKAFLIQRCSYLRGVIKRGSNVCAIVFCLYAIVICHDMHPRIYMPLHCNVL